MVPGSRSYEHVLFSRLLFVFSFFEFNILVIELQLRTSSMLRTESNQSEPEIHWATLTEFKSVEVFLLVVFAVVVFVNCREQQALLGLLRLKVVALKI